MRKLILALVIVSAPLAAAQASSIQSALPKAELRGVATFRYVGFPIYEARLYTKSGAPLDWSEDFGLELKYLRNLSENDLVDSTIQEISRMGAALPIRDQLQRCFDDVRRGDRFVAVTQGQNKISFWLNGNRTCTLSHPQVTSRFMAIFLGANTRSKSFTRQLKGE